MTVYTIPGAQPSLIFAASDGRHRPASHPVLRGLPRFDVEPRQWPMAGHAIRQRRRAHGLSQEALGRLVGVSRPAVAQWEADIARPSPEHEARLREVLT